MPQNPRIAALRRSAHRWRQKGEVPVIVIVGLGLLLGLGLYWYTTPQAAPSWARRWLPAAQSSPGQINNLYRWKDMYGVEHITDKPPVGRPYDVVTSPGTSVTPFAIDR